MNVMNGTVGRGMCGCVAVQNFYPNSAEPIVKTILCDAHMGIEVKELRTEIDRNF